MEKMFKKYEVSGETMDLAKEQVKDFNLMVNATSAYKNWLSSNLGASEEETKEWMKTYLQNKKYDKAGLGAYIIIKNAILDKRERPYKVNKIKYEVRTHTPKSVYIVRNANKDEVARADKANEAVALAKEHTIAYHESVNVFRETVYKEDNSLYATVDYTPSKNACEAQILVFGYVSVED